MIRNAFVLLFSVTFGFKLRSLSIYDEPVTINNCQHTFCQVCLKNLSTFQSPNANPVPFACPICKRLIKNRAFHLDEKFKSVVKCIIMIETYLEKCLKDKIEGSSRKTALSISYTSTAKEHRDDRLHHFLDDCITSVNKPQHAEEIFLVSSDENTDNTLLDNTNLSINVENVSISKSSINKNKASSTTIKNSARKKKNSGSAAANRQIILSDTAVPQANIRQNNARKQNEIIFTESESTDVEIVSNVEKGECETPETPDVCPSGEKVEIINCIEEDFLNNIENEFDVVKEHNESAIVTRKSSKNASKTEQKKKTEWSRLKTIKNQIKKKEVKYKQLKINTDTHNLRSNDIKSKRLEVIHSSETNENQITNKRRSGEYLDNLRSNDVQSKHLQVININKNQIINERRSGENLDNLLDCLNKNDNANTALEEDDIFAALTQKLNHDNPNNVMEFAETSTRTSEKRKSNIEIIEPEPKKSKSSTSSDNVIFNKIVVEADVHCKPLKNANHSSPKRKTRSQEILNVSNKNTEEENEKPSEISQIEIHNSTENLCKHEDIKHELKVISQKREEMLSQFTNGLRATINVVQQCENYIYDSQSLFSDTSSKNSKNNASRSDTDVPSKTNLLSVGLYSLPCLSESLTDKKIKFLTGAIPSLKKIGDFYSQIISLSQRISQESEILHITEIAPKKINCEVQTDTNFYKYGITPKKINCEVQTDTCFDHHQIATEKISCGVQTDIFECSKCCYIFNHQNDNISNTSILNEPIYVEEHIDNNYLENEAIKSKTVVRKSFQEIYEEVQKTSGSKREISKQGKEESSFPLQSSGSDVVKNRKANRHLNFTDCQVTLNKSLDHQNKNYKRIRVATSDSDSDTESTGSKTSKRSKHESSRTKLYDNNLDVVFCSEMSGHDIPVENIPAKKTNVKMFENLTSDQSDHDFNESKYISILENDYKNVRFDKKIIENSPKNIECEKLNPITENIDSSLHNTVLDNLLSGINLSSFEDEPNIIENNCKDSELMDVIAKSPPEPEPMSVSMFLDTEKSPKNTLTGKPINKKEEDDALDQEVADLTSAMVDAFESDQDIFEDDNVVESTPQKDVSNVRDKNKVNLDSKEDKNVIDLIDPPELLTINSQFYMIDICPPPPPLQFQDSEKVFPPIDSTHLNVISITSDILPLDNIDLNKPYTGSSVNINSQRSISFHDHITRVKQIDNHDVENVAPRNITPTFESKNCGVKVANKSLNPIVLAQEEAFTPLQLIPAIVPKQNIPVTPKQQSSILSYMTPQKFTINKGSTTTTDVTKSNEKTSSRRQTPIKNSTTILSKMPQKCASISQLNVTKSSSNLSSIINAKYEAVIAYTRLTQNEVITVMSLGSKFNVRCVKDFDKNVTHLVVGTDNQNRAKDHTIKYILGIAHGLWILSMGWIMECVAQNRLVSEESYEVLDISKLPGPRISRLTRNENPLLADYKIYLTHPFVNINIKDVENAILAVGGEIVKLPEELLKRNGKICLVLSDAKVSEDFDYYQEFRESYHTIVADVEWLSQSIGRYQIMSIIPYLLCLDNGIEHLGYPSALLMPVPESQSQMTCTNK